MVLSISLSILLSFLIVSIFLVRSFFFIIACYICNEGQASLHQASIADDEDIEGLKKITEIIHNNGSKVFAQINHARDVTTHEITGYSILSANPINLPAKRSKEMPKEMDLKDIDKIIRNFADATLRAKKAGFDGVEIHSAYGYLLNQFYSPFSNQ